MDYIKIFNQILSSSGAKGYLIEKRECKPGPLNACKTLLIELWWHQKGKNALLHTFELRTIVKEGQKDKFYDTLKEDVLYYLFEHKDEILNYGI